MPPKPSSSAAAAAAKPKPAPKAAAAVAPSSPGCLWFTIGLLIQLVLLLVCIVLGWLAFVYFSPDIGSFGTILPDDESFPIDDERHFFDFSIASYETINGLNVLKAGNESGTLLLFLHGFPETALLSWHRQIEFFASRGYFVVAPDQRGYNTSSKPEGIDSYSLTLLSRDIVGIIDHFGREKVTVVAHDWGALVLWDICMSDLHSRIEKAIVLNVPHPYVMQQTLRTSWTQMKNSWYMLFFQFPWVPEVKMSKDNFRWLTGALAMSPPGTYSRAVVQLYHEAWAQEGALTAMLNWYRALMRSILARRKVDIRVPASVPLLLIWGDQDSALDVSMAQPSVDMCDNGRLEFVRGASHWVQHDEPERVNELILNHLSE